MVAIITGNGFGLERSSLSVLGSGGKIGNAALGRGGQNVFVNAATGSLNIQRQDEWLVGRGPDQTLESEFSTGSAYWHTPNWRSIYGLTGTVNTAGSTITRMTAFYDQVTYSYDAARGAYVSKEGGGAHDEIRFANGVWSFTDGNSRKVEYYEQVLGATYMVSRVVDTDGNTQTYTYDSTGACIARITNADGSYVEMTHTNWRPNEIKTSYTNASGGLSTMTRVRYTWDPSVIARLQTLTVDLTPHDNSIADGNVYRINYGYDGSTQRLTSITQTDGSRLDIAYDASGRVISYTETISAGVTRTTTLSYETDAQGNKFTRVRDAQLQDTLLYYDAKGQLTKTVTPPPVAGAGAATVSYAYNADGDVLSVTDALGNATTFTYDSNGNVLTETDSFGNSVTRTYGAKNELLRETRWGSHAGAADALLTTRYAYDSENHLRYIVTPKGFVTEFRYTAAGEVEYTIEYPENAYPSANYAPEVLLSEAQLNTWRDSLADRSSTKITYNSYDARGQLATSTRYGIATAAGAASTAEGYGRTTYVYDQAGRLLSRMNEGQGAEAFLYDAMGRIIGATDLNGGTTSIAFNDAATQTVVTLANGLVQTSTYNKAGDLLSSVESGSYVAGGTSTHKYDKLGRLRMTTDATGFNTYHLYDKVGRRVADINHKGDLTEYRYDANNRPIATIRYANAVSSGYFASLADPNSTIELATVRPAYSSADVCVFTFYDKEGRVTATVDGSGSVQSHEYNKGGELVKTVSYYNKLASWQIDGFKSNTPLTVSLPAADARDSVARNFYDREGRLLAVLDGEGYLTRLTFDQAGQKVAETSFVTPTNPAYRASGTLSDLNSSTPAHPDDRRIQYVYDGRGLLRFLVDGLNQVTGYGYDAADQRISTIRYAGAIAATSDYTYDNVKALVAASGLAGSAQTRRSWSVYDSAGRLAFSIDAEDAVTRFVYDNRGQVTKIVQYAAKRTGTTSLPSYATMDSWGISNDGNAGNRVTRHYYSARGERRFTVDSEGYVGRTDFDAAGRTTREVRWDTALAGVHDGWTIDTVNAYAAGTWSDKRYGYDFGGALTDQWDGENNWTRYSYNANGTLASRTVVEPNQSWILYQYDGAGRVVAEHAAHGTPEQASTFYAYDGHGNVVSVTDPRGNVTSRSYDRLGQLLTETTAAGTVSYQYNAFGEAVKATDARGYSSYSYYDRLGRLAATRNAEDYVTETGHNVFGDAVSVVRRYNRANNAASAAVLPTYVAHAQDATTSFEYDRLGRLVKSTDAEGHYEQYTLDAFGNRISVRNKIGGIVTNAYDRRGLLVAETLPMASYDNWGNVISWSVTNRFEYDARGNMTKKIEAHGLAEQRTTTNVYDKADRLVETRGDAVSVLNQGDHVSLSSVAPSQKYKYDQSGRLIETTDALGGRTLYYYDKLNRKTVEIGANGAYTAFTYDKNGNILTRRIYGTAVGLPGTAGGAAPAAPGGEYRETSYTYDALNQLKTSSVANIRTGAWNASYYATGVGTVTTTYDYDSNGNLIRTTDGNGGTSFTFYDKANRRIASVDQENYLTFYTLDGEGNVTQEERFANRLGFAVATTYDAAWMRSTVAGNAADRVTQFVYDKNGRRTSEWRLYINSNYVSGNALGVDGAHGGIQYAYNGLGQVSQKTYGNGDYVSYIYDASGRLTQESRAPFVDMNGTLVRPTTFYYYNGVDNLTLSRQGGLAQSGGDRLTRYTYGAGGRMTSMIDAAGSTYNYFHDAAGNVVRENYNRTRSDGSVVTEGLLYNRDSLGRVTSQGLATWQGYWAKADRQDTEYNVYGDVSRRGINGGWQEQFAYDGAGRMVRSNSGDGVWRFFVHDANGNQTLTIESEGTNLAGYSVDQALSVATAGGAYHIGGAYIDGINSTINVFDKRGQAVQTRMPQRQLNDTSAATNLNVGRTYTAFGEVASETDARGFVTDYLYNTMGRLIEKRSPTVAYTTESGAVGTARPTEYYYYDRAGRMIGARDANGNLTSRVLLAGTGHDGSEALVSYEYHADGGYLRNDYDVFGDRRVAWDEINRRTDMSYDAMGRVTQITRPNGLIDYFGYDQLGQKTSHWNNLLQTPIYGPPQQVWVEDGYWDNYYGWVDTSHWETHTPVVGYAPDKELTDYDLQGRVTRQVAFGGDTTTTSYAWNGGIATGGMGTFGGWTETTTMANGRSSTEQTDVFGRQVYRSDLGGHVYTFSYDLAGRMIQRSGTETLNYTWLNTGKVAQSFSATGVYGSQQWTRKGTTYGYDAGGNLTSERFADEGHSTYQYWDPYYGYQYSDYSWSTVSKNATATYDGLNRMVTWAEAGSASMASASTAFSYDLVGNIRRSNSTYRGLENNGAQTTYNLTQDNWYRFDSMNRLVTKGSLVGGQIVRGYGGADYLYDKAGQRVSATLTTQGEAYIYDPYAWDPYYGNNQYMLVYYDAETREDYSYDAGGVLSSVRVAQGGYTDNWDGTLTVHGAPAYAQLRASYTNDLMGRVTRQIDWLGDGTSAGYDRTVTYNAKGQVTNETVVSKQGADTLTTYSSHDFGSGSNYALGAVVYSSSTTYKNGAYQSVSSTSTGYVWYEGALQSSISTTTTTYSPSYSSSTHTTTLTYDGSGSLSSIYIGDGRPRSVTFVNDANGQTIKRDESDNNWNQYTGGDPHEIWHRFGGKQMGYVGNNGTLDTDYATSINNRTRTPGNGAFRFGTSYGGMSANFDLSNEAITSYSQGVVAGGYTVRQGDTLESIAASLWGDSSLWYKLAAANGMTSPNGLSEGQRITIPAGVMKSHHNAATFRPFDPAETLGDISPTTPQPQKAGARRANKCGLFGTIILAVVAAVVAYLMPPLIPALGPVVSGALTAAAVNVVTQGIGVATGLQDKFSWKGVAFAAIGGGIGGGLSSLGGKFGAFLNADKFVSNVAKGALSNGLAQGVGVATGLQKKFDWAGVAISGLTAGVEGAVGRAMPGKTGELYEAADRSIKLRAKPTFLNSFAANGAGAIASATARSLLTGTSFGDNLLAVLPGAIGSTIGNALAAELFGPADVTVLDAATRAELARRRAAAGQPLVSGAGAQALQSATGQALVDQQNPLAPAAGPTAATVPPAQRGRIIRRAGRAVIVTDLNLTLPDYLQAVQDGLWLRLENPIVQGASQQQTGTINNSNQLNTAYQNATGVADNAAADFAAAAALLQMVRAVANATNGTRISGNDQSFEKAVSFALNAQGQFVVRSIQVLGRRGGRPYIETGPNGMVAFLHTHYYDPQEASWHRPGGGDATVPRHYGISAFVMAERPNQTGPVALFEIGRTNGKYKQRRINPQGIPGNWSAGDHAALWNP
ncbi:MAG TPA: LysM peptidoglycan-binding domain-containing protein [Allosphingosinicella sp.]|jgi:YD repeat-containing protein